MTVARVVAIKKESADLAALVSRGGKAAKTVASALKHVQLKQQQLEQLMKSGNKQAIAAAKSALAQLKARVDAAKDTQASAKKAAARLLKVKEAAAKAKQAEIEAKAKAKLAAEEQARLKAERE